MKFTILFFILMGVLGIHKIITLYLTKKNQEIKVTKDRLINTIGTFYLLIFFGTIIEYFILKPRVNFLISIFGVSLCFFGVWFQIWSFQSLKDNWSFYIEPKDKAKLITDKAYKYFRHPASLGFIFEGVGIPLVFNTFFIFLLALLIYSPLILLRIYFEEKILIKKFGRDYLEYKSRTPILFKLKK